MKKKSNNVNASAVAAPKERLVRVDIIVGLLMVLVVLGHLAIDPRVPDWYSRGLLQWIYSFHMEAFVLMSGFLIAYAYKGVHSLKDYGAYVGRKFKKFFVWFLVIGLAAYLIPWLLAWRQGAAATGLGVTLWQGLRQMLLYPMRSEASFLWYIYLLFGFYLVTPLYLRLPVWVQRAVCVVTLLLPVLDAGHLLAAERFCRYSCFYCLGVQCALGVEELRAIKTWSWGLLALPFVAFSVWLGVTGFQTQESPMPFLGVITGFMSLPLLYFVALLIERCGWLTRLLAHISRDCYWIYLLQMFFIWGLKGLLFALGLEDWPYFFRLFMPLAVIVAVAGPILMKALWRRLVSPKHQSPSPAKA